MNEKSALQIGIDVPRLNAFQFGFSFIVIA